MVLTQEPTGSLPPLQPVARIKQQIEMLPPAALAEVFACCIKQVVRKQAFGAKKLTDVVATIVATLTGTG